MTFADLNLDSCLLRAIAEQGYQQPTPIQAQAIPAILLGKDVMAGAQTGTGKTAAFTLPILQQLLAQQFDRSRLRALVLVPTRELAQQVEANVRIYASHTDIKVAIAYGGASIGPQIVAIKQGIDILVATPGRLLDLLSRQILSLDAVQHLVFDEADRMLDMGFKEEINQIRRRLPNQRQNLLFSATFDDGMFNFSQRMLTEPELIQVDQRNSAAAKVSQMLYVVDSDRKREFTSYLIGSKNWQQVLIFTKTKQGADELAREMNKDGLKTEAIHGDKSQGARERGLQQFKNKEIRALVATDVAARGIDVQALQYVINYDLPYIAEDYVHRIGRCGRAGLEGTAVSLMAPGEEYLLEEIESVLDERIPQQWYPGFEPDFTKEVADNSKNSRGAQKRRAKKRSGGGRSGNRRRG
ncbi:DEAD/DEAH box helicase [Ferrimonas lipolytica]|uniref:DEAD-box ATP-dependent RNA helicase RhpA n=1 Tax=Ferrimonas lipolytica TaxID=2724191 RepID=A0A6H1UE73_9GAMM|nr:DEAD/DEAH box helicase [Ferrimonas lipolytica]QIZ77128.1 DEAD/DEAH box helicase [Ferrimonas lipolytica]